ncbi:MAG: excinuclease ABC subunit UvrC [Lachnospiraceae bacterium]|nr:excinuclease ABC subunit UvrC [Lachnospiraceae bacterium]MDD6192851.1 excinuclease ABC subunit UvrC [Lachnospiraceae bacterium]
MKSQFSIEEELAKLPDSPGVYIMHNAKDAIIYVGKAISLRHRVRQYFQPSHDEGIKKAQMVKQIAYFEYIVTDSELEALVLECNLIKEHRPKYNTMLRDDKTYPYIKVTLGEPYPRVLFSRQIKKDKSKYFGPFTSAAAVKDTIDLIQKIYHLRTCTKKFPDSFGKERPCLNYHMKQCLGVCTGNISTEEYQKNVDGAMAFLNGNYQPVIKMLEEKMQDAAGKMEFEKAAEYRNLLGSVNACMQKQKITNANQEGDRDIVALAQSGEDAVVQVFFVRKGKLIGREHFFMNVRLEEVAEEIITDFIQQFYAGTPVIPKEIFLQMELPQQEILERWLSEKKGQKVYLKSPQKGMNNKLVELAEKNAAMVLAQDKERIKKEEGRTIGALKELAGLLHMENLNRMEAFDISNINGFQTVGSMVVFEKGKPLRSDYRKFKLKTITGPDDYGSMREVLTRRFSHGIQEREELKEKGLEEQLGSFTRFPDVIMMDGGRGQVNICLEVLQELGLSIPVCGMVKDDHHRTRGLYVDNVEIPIDKNSEAFHLITRLQDEAHRFAIEYHRSLRSKGQVHSFLDDIEGIGPARRKALMRKYNSAEEMGSATVEELAEIPSMDLRSAQSVYDYFHGLTNRGNTLK